MENHLDTTPSTEEQQTLSNTVEEQTNPNISPITELMDSITTLLDKDQLPEKSDMERLSGMIYRRSNSSSDSQEPKEEISDDSTQAKETEMIRFLNLQERYKKLRAKEQEALRLQLEKNLEQKSELLKRMEALLESKEDFSKIHAEFREIQEAWKAIGELPPQRKSEVISKYQELMNSFYEIKSITNEYRDLDFAKNKEIKEKLIEEARKLSEGEEVISAFNQLQLLHDQWKETGPVAPEDRVPLWSRFKEVSTIINKRHQDHFAQLKAKEEDNLKLKTGLCEQIEELIKKLPDTSAGWSSLVAKVKEIEEEWRKIGYAPKKFNTSIYQRFRAVQTEIYKARSNFYKEAKNAIKGQLEKYQELVERAEALKDSTEWKATAEKIQQLREEWKEVGKLGIRSEVANNLWKKFTTACNTFFDKRGEAFKEREKSFSENLKSKKEIIAKLSALKERSEENIAGEIEALRSEWEKIGFIARKYKDSINDSFYGLLRELQGQGGNRRQKAEVSEMSNKGLQGEYNFLSKAIAQKNEEIIRYETNLGFFSDTDPKSNPLVKPIIEKIDQLKKEQEGNQARLDEVKRRMRESQE